MSVFFGTGHLQTCARLILIEVRVLAVLILSAPLMAQAVSAGLRAGVSVSPPFTTQAAQTQPNSRFTIGPSVEMHLWGGAALGADLLLRRASFEFPPAAPAIAIWQAEAPVTFLYRFHGRAKPFLRAGMTFNRVLAVAGATVCARGPFGEQFYCLDGGPAAELRHRGVSGFVVGGGIGWEFHKFRIEPEVRVTHWFERNFGVRDSGFRSNLSQAALLVGMTF